MSKQKKWGITAIFLVVASWLIWSSFSGKHHREEPPKLTVLVTKVVKKSVPLTLEFPGSIESVESVAVKSQVSGTLQAIGFKAGDTVAAQQLLFTIDPAPFQQKLAQAKQNLIKDQATLKSAMENERRARSLISKKYVSQQEYDTLQAQQRSQQAIVNSDLSLIRDAEINLSYTQIRAPIQGRTGDISVKVGDLVTQDSATPLVTINQLGSVYATFQVPQDKLAQIQKYANSQTLTVEIFGDNNNKMIGTGPLVFIDNKIMTESGTILLKATIPNQEGTLWPAQLILVKLILTNEANVLVIPSRSIRMDQQGAYVFVVENNHAKIRRVQVARQEASESIISSGVKEGEQVITTVPAQLQDNATVNIGSTS